MSLHLKQFMALLQYIWRVCSTIINHSDPAFAQRLNIFLMRLVLSIHLVTVPSPCVHPNSGTNYRLTSEIVPVFKLFKQLLKLTYLKLPLNNSMYIVSNIIFNCHYYVSCILHFIMFIHVMFF